MDQKWTAIEGEATCSDGVSSGTRVNKARAVVTLNNPETDDRAQEETTIVYQMVNLNSPYT